VSCQPSKVTHPVLTYRNRHVHREDLFNPQVAYNPYDFHNLSQQLDFMSLSTYISTFAPRNFPSKIVVTHPPYIKSVHRILADTPSYVLSAYFVTRLGLGYSKFLGPATPVRQATRKLQVVLQGLKKGVPEDRQQFCQAYADELQGLGLLGGKEFVDRAFGGDSKTKAESVIYSSSMPLLCMTRRTDTKTEWYRRHHRRLQGSSSRCTVDGC